MRIVKCYDIHGVSVQSVIDEFNERRVGEFRINDADIISISVRDAIKPMGIHTPEGSKQSSVVVSIFYWADK